MNLSKEIEIILGNLFRENRVAFFCGAGLSFNSGIPVVSAITLEILSTLLQDENEAKDLRALLELSKRPFEAFMQTVINLSGDDQLLDVFKLGRPNANHILIALLCKSKTIDEVFTTNFDLLIEEALRDVGLEEGKDFLVFSSEKEFKKGLSLIKKKDSRIKIFKIHGSIHNKATIRTTLESIGRKEWLMQRLKVIQYAFCFQHNTTLLIEGYSFSDFFDTNSVLKSLTNKKDIFCVHHCSDQTEGVLIDLRAEKLNNNISNWDVGSKVIANTGQITELLWRMNNFYPIDNNEFYKQIEIN